MTNSAVQQRGGHSTQTQTISYGAQEAADIAHLLSHLVANLDELQLEVKERKRADKQIAILRHEISDDEPDPIVVRQAGRTLRGTPEGAIARLVALPSQSATWLSLNGILVRLFP